MGVTTQHPHLCPSLRSEPKVRPVMTMTKREMKRSIRGQRKAALDQQSEQAYHQKLYRREMRREKLKENGKKTLVFCILLSVAIFTLFFAPFLQDFRDGMAPMIQPVISFISDPLGVDWDGLFMKFAAVLIMHIGIFMIVMDELNGRR